VLLQAGVDIAGDTVVLLQGCWLPMADDAAKVRRHSYQWRMMLLQRFGGDATVGLKGACCHITTFFTMVVLS
jgi:hypothetical protein